MSQMLIVNMNKQMRQDWEWLCRDNPKLITSEEVFARIMKDAIELSSRETGRWAR